jgi:hypothetical protein
MRQLDHKITTSKDGTNLLADFKMTQLVSMDAFSDVIKVPLLFSHVDTVKPYDPQDSQVKSAYFLGFDKCSIIIIIIFKSYFQGDTCQIKLV